MNHLPTLVLIKIFKNYLNIKDRIKCKLVCRNWYYLVHSIRPSECLIHSSAWSSKKWTFTNVPLEYRSSIEVSPEQRLNYRFFQINFANIQKLYLDSCHSYSSCKKFIIDDVRFLSYFKQLKQLEIHTLRLVQTSIDLPLLKVLTLKGCQVYDLKIIAPQLDAFVCWNYFGEIKFVYDSLRYFECDEYYSDILNFRQLECLYCKFINPIDRNLVQSLPELKQLHLFSYLVRPPVLNDLIDEKNRLRRTDLIISYSGFRDIQVGEPFIDTEDTNCFNLTENNMKAIKDHYAKVIFRIPWTTKLNYTSLKTHFNHQIPLDFHLKFSNINEVDITDTDHHPSVVQFLRQCNSIQFLTLKNRTAGKSFAQAFLDSLTLVPTILSLQIEEIDWTVQDYKFLGGLKNLMYIRFELNCPVIHPNLIRTILIDFVYFAFKQCKYFKEFAYSQHQFVVTVRFLNQFYLAIAGQNYTFNSIEETLLCLKDVLMI